VNALRTSAFLDPRNGVLDGEVVLLQLRWHMVKGRKCSRLKACYKWNVPVRSLDRQDGLDLFSLLFDG